jgi:hypothetical protein
MRITSFGVGSMFGRWDLRGALRKTAELDVGVRELAETGIVAALAHRLQHPPWRAQ